MKTNNSHSWNPKTKEKLYKFIAKGKNQNNFAVFDFDNTVICRDIGEATAAYLIQQNILTKDKIKQHNPPQFLYNNELVNLDNQVDIAGYYEKFLYSTKHQLKDESPYETSYAWSTKILSGLSPFEIVQATQKTFNNEYALKDFKNLDSETIVSATPGQTFYRVPFFYPEIVELMNELIENKIEIYIISASNIWTVRFMVLEYLNKKLSKPISPQNVIGTSTLIIDDKFRLYKDMSLVLENPKYASLDLDELKKYKLTQEIAHPLTCYHGKITAMLKYIGREPYLVSGDSSNDFPMLNYSKYKLWIARLDSPDYQSDAIKQFNETWCIQPTLVKKSPGFVSSLEELNERFKNNIPTDVKKSLEILDF